MHFLHNKISINLLHWNTKIHSDIIIPRPLWFVISWNFRLDFLSNQKEYSLNIISNFCILDWQTCLIDVPRSPGWRGATQVRLVQLDRKDAMVYLVYPAETEHLAEMEETAHVDLVAWGGTTRKGLHQHFPWGAKEQRGYYQLRMQQLFDSVKRSVLIWRV